MSNEPEAKRAKNTANMIKAVLIMECDNEDLNGFSIYEFDGRDIWIL